MRRVGVPARRSELGERGQCDDEPRRRADAGRGRQDVPDLSEAAVMLAGAAGAGPGELEGGTMPVKKVEKIWMNGKLVNWDDARIHVLSHVVHYGSSWFEGIRCYETKKGPAIYRLESHLRRLYDSVRIYRTEIPFTVQQIEQAILDTIRANRMRACYIRPIVYRGYGEVGVNPLACPVDVSIAVWEWGSYLGPEALTDG